MSGRSSRVLGGRVPDGRGPSPEQSLAAPPCPPLCTPSLCGKQLSVRNQFQGEVSFEHNFGGEINFESNLISHQSQSRTVACNHAVLPCTPSLCQVLGFRVGGRGFSVCQVEARGF